MSRPAAAGAGAAAALVWGALEPIDMRIFRNDYSDVAVLGKLVTRTSVWPVAGIAFHLIGTDTPAVHRPLRISGVLRHLDKHRRPSLAYVLADVDAGPHSGST